MGQLAAPKEWVGELGATAATTTATSTFSPSLAGTPPPGGWDAERAPVPAAAAAAPASPPEQAKQAARRVSRGGDVAAAPAVPRDVEGEMAAARWREWSPRPDVVEAVSSCVTHYRDTLVEGVALRGFLAAPSASPYGHEPLPLTLPLT